MRPRRVFGSVLTAGRDHPGRVPVAVGTNYVADEVQWRNFFRDAQMFRAKAEARLGKVASYLEGDTTLRTRLLCQGFGRLVRYLLRPHMPQRDGEAQIILNLVADNDIRGQSNQALFCDTIVHDWAKNSRLIWDFNIVPIATASCKTEQEEPLLLLADYIAGAYHHADPRTLLGSPVVEPVDAAQAVVELRKAHHAPYEYERTFDRVYPLQYEGQRVVLRL